MKHYKISVVAILCILLLGLAVVVMADDPPKTGDNVPETTTNPPPPPIEKGSFDPVPIRSGTRDLDPASVTSLNVVEDNDAPAPAAASVGPSIPAVVVEKGSTAPGPIMLGQFDGQTLRTIPDSATTAYDLIISSPD